MHRSDDDTPHITSPNSSIERFVNVAPGVDLRLLDHGADTAGRTFVLVHGLASNARLWDGVAHHLVDAGHRAIAVDQRGHGRSSKPDHGYDFATVTNDLALVVESLGIERPVVVGQSWGGNVVIEMAARRPDHLSAVVAVDGGFIELGAHFPLWDDCRELLAPPRLIGTALSTMERWIRDGHRDWPESGIVGTLANFEVRDDGTIAPWLTFDRHIMILRELYDHRPLDTMAEIQVPVLLVPADSGDASWTSDKHAAVESALAVLPDGRVRWFSPAHHDIHAQYPAELADVLVRFAEEALSR